MSIFAFWVIILPYIQLKKKNRNVFFNWFPKTCIVTLFKVNAYMMRTFVTLTCNKKRITTFMSSNNHSSIKGKNYIAIFQFKITHNLF